MKNRQGRPLHIQWKQKNLNWDDQNRGVVRKVGQKRKYKNFINSTWINQENLSKFRIIWIYEQSKKKTSGMEAITKEKRRKNYEGEHGTI